MKNKGKMKVSTRACCFDPAVQAFIGARVSWERRGLAIGLVEVAWAGSSLIGIPLIGWLIGRHGWRSPFLVLGLCAVAGFALLALILPRGQPARAAGAGRLTVIR